MEKKKKENNDEKKQEELEKLQNDIKRLEEELGTKITITRIGPKRVSLGNMLIIVFMQFITSIMVLTGLTGLIPWCDFTSILHLLLAMAIFVIASKVMVFIGQKYLPGILNLFGLLPIFITLMVFIITMILYPNITISSYPLFFIVFFIYYVINSMRDQWILRTFLLQRKE